MDPTCNQKRIWSHRTTQQGSRAASSTRSRPPQRGREGERCKLTRNRVRQRIWRRRRCPCSNPPCRLKRHVRRWSCWCPYRRALEVNSGRKLQPLAALPRRQRLDGTGKIRINKIHMPCTCHAHHSCALARGATPLEFHFRFRSIILQRTKRCTPGRTKNEEGDRDRGRNSTV